MSAVIQAVEIGKYFGSKKALKGLSFAAQAGDTVALMGMNGAGKTTLINILATLLSADEGEVKYFGQPFKGNETEIRLRLGLVSHQLLLYADLTVEENLRFYTRLYTLPNAEQRIGEVVDLVGLARQRNQVLHTLSRGMQQRLAIGRALLHDPAILLLDEPFTGLDQFMVGRMLDLLQNIAGQEKTIIMASHNFKEVAALATHVLFLHRGACVDAFAVAGIDERSLAERYQKMASRGES